MMHRRGITRAEREEKAHQTLMKAAEAIADLVDRSRTEAAFVLRQAAQILDSKGITREDTRCEPVAHRVLDK